MTTSRKSTVWTSQPTVIGRHEWRLTLIDFINLLGRKDKCIGYEWRKIPNSPTGVVAEAEWQDVERWPTFDINDTDEGLPRSLRRLYEQHEGAVRAWCDKGEVPGPDYGGASAIGQADQLALF
jgi:hypothetical protein